MKRVAVALCLGLALAAGLISTADAQPRPTFEVASVKPSDPNPSGPLGGQPMVLPALGRLTAQNVTLRMLIVASYQKMPFQIVMPAGHDWINSAKFDITARAEGSPGTDQLLEMLRTLLADRFKLKSRLETREVPIYALVVARDDGRLGPKLKASTDTCPDFKVQQQQQLEALAKGGVQALAGMMAKPGENRPCSIATEPRMPEGIYMKATGQSLDLLTLLLTQLSGRPVVNKTGLTGPHDFEFMISMQTLMQIYAELGVNMPLPPNLPEGPSLMTQVQEELGLKLDSQRGPHEVLVIDGAEMPTPD